jgi:arginase
MSKTSRNKPVRVIPYLCGCGAYTAGCEDAALALQKAGLVSALRRQGVDIDWWRDPRTAEFDYKALGLKLRPPAGSKAREDVVYFHLTQLCEDVAQALKEGYRVVTIGGDHSMAIGSVAGLARAKNALGKTGLLWVDAHPDIHTMKTSRRKTFHAVAVSMLLGEGERKFSGMACEDGAFKSALDPRHVAFLGLRSIDEPELHQIARYNIKTYTNGDLDQFGLKRSFTESLAHISKGTKARFLSLDLDAIDPVFAPGVGTAVPGGLDEREILEVLKGAGRKADFDVIELTEYNPSLDPDLRTAKLARKILSALLT